jgi:hypothetical protein
LETVGQSIEKDFWVCRVIDALFHGLPNRPKLFFRGGTSLSKGFNLISRFSEDIDLTISPFGLGKPGTVTTERDPSRTDASQTRIQKNIEFVAPLAQAHVKKHLVPRLQALLPDCKVKLIDEPRDQRGSEIEVQYDLVLPKRGSPWITIETGIRLGREPETAVSIEPYCQSAVAANALMLSLATPQVAMISPARTLWEKCLIIHQINDKTHRKTQRGDFNKLSRHYYDVAKIAKSKVGADALTDPALLERTRQHAVLSGRLNAGQLDLAVPATMILRPPDDLVRQLEADYKDMEGMMFGKPPAFKDICAELSKFEERLRASVDSPAVAA